MPPGRVSGVVQDSGRDMPAVGGVTSKRRHARIRLVNLRDEPRGPNQGAPTAATLNIYPFPFQGMYKPARHGHYPLWKVAAIRHLGAWRAGGTGTLGGNYYAK